MAKKGVSNISETGEGIHSKVGQKMKKVIGPIALGVLLSMSACQGPKEKEMGKKGGPKIEAEAPIKTEKQEFLDSLSIEDKKLVLAIDSLRDNLSEISIPYDLKDRVSIKKDNNKFIVTEPYDYEWEEKYYGEFDEPQKITNMHAHLGKAYTREVAASFVYNPDDPRVEPHRYVQNFRYGVLLAPEKVGNKVWPKGTLVGSYWYPEHEIDSQKVIYIYFTDIREFEDRVEEMTHDGMGAPDEEIYIPYYGSSISL